MTTKEAKDDNNNKNKAGSSSLPFEIREQQERSSSSSSSSAAGGGEEQQQGSRKKRIEAYISSEKLDAVLTAIGSLKLEQHITIQKVRARVKSIQFLTEEELAAQKWHILIGRQLLQ